MAFSKNLLLFSLLFAVLLISSEVVSAHRLLAETTDTAGFHGNDHGHGGHGNGGHGGRGGHGAAADTAGHGGHGNGGHGGRGGHGAAADTTGHGNDHGHGGHGGRGGHGAAADTTGHDHGHGGHGGHGGRGGHGAAAQELRPEIRKTFVACTAACSGVYVHRRLGGVPAGWST